eukprot:gene8389-8476_t
MSSCMGLFYGINTSFFTDDQGLYASIAKNLFYKKDFLELFTYSQDWLDKPHFPFWAILLSFKLFGVSAWAYRLPALLCFCTSLLYTYLFTRKYYGWEIASTAVIILMTALHVLLSNTDVRAEPYLMAFIIGAIYHISQLDERFSVTDLLMAAVLTALALMTKGLFVIIAIYGSLIGHLLLQQRFKTLFKIKWLLLVLLTLLFIIPELYALYIQFDLHPEKIVFGKHHVSGIRWFLWDSQFGRFANNGPISRKSPGSVFFFLHTLLWAFAPWGLLFYYGVFNNVKDFLSGKKLTEYYAMSGGILLLVLFSLSRFQLPFYTNAVFPLFAIITAPFCVNKLTAPGLVINFFLRPVHDIYFGADCILLGILVIFIPMYFKELHQKSLFFAFAAALFAGVYLNTIFYRAIIPYKGEISATAYINQSPLSHFPDNYEIQVYGSETVDAGHTMFELHSNFTFDGSKFINGGVLPTDHVFHETIEITHGWTPWPRVAAPESWKWPVGVSLSLEYGFQKAAYSADTETLEIRPIVDKKWGKTYIALNPTLDQSFKGANAGRGLIFSPNVKGSYDVSKVVALGLEYYGSTGPFFKYDPLQQQQHQLFVATDLNLNPNWEFNAGYGRGFTSATDRSIFKVILGRRF